MAALSSRVLPQTHRANLMGQRKARVVCGQCWDRTGTCMLLGMMGVGQLISEASMFWGSCSSFLLPDSRAKSF